MKVKLLMPPRSFLNEKSGMISIPPLGIAHLASFLKNKGYYAELDDLDIKVISDKKLFNKLLDLQRKYNQNDLKNYLLNNEDNPYLDEITYVLLKKLKYKGYDILGFSILESSAIDFTLLISKKMKAETGCKIVLGGTAVDPNLKRTYNFIDHVIRGSGETDLLNIIYQLENKPQLKEFPSLFPKPMPDFSGLPFSCYRNIPRHSNFSNPGKILILPCIWSWGCSYKCSFCKNSLSAFKPVLKSPLQTVKELKELSRKYNTKHFFVYNDYIHIDEKHTIKLAEELIKQKVDILWCGCIRCNINPKILPLLFKAGCFYIAFGMESASNKILKRMRKGYTRSMAERAIKAAHDAGMWVSLYIIVSFPHETERDFNETFDFVHRNIDYIDQINAGPFYLTDSVMLKNPEKFGIKIRESVGIGNTSRNVYGRYVYAYDEIGGFSWEEIQRLKMKRLYKIHKLFYMHKKIPERVLRADIYQLFHAFDKFRNKKSVLRYLQNECKKYRNSRERAIPVTNKCNNNCLFCKKPSEAVESLEDIRERVRALKKRGIKKIIISGGEPTIQSSIFEIIRLIKDEGLDIKLNTNARMLSYGSFCKRLYNTGLRTISVPIYSNRPEVHDNVTRVPGSLEQAVHGIDNWKKLGGEVEVRTSLFKENKEDMSKFVDFILELETNPVF